MCSISNTKFQFIILEYIYMLVIIGKLIEEDNNDIKYNNRCKK